MCKEVFDLLNENFREVCVGLYLVVALRQLSRWHGDDFLVAASVVFHHQHANRAAIDDRTREDRARIADEHVDRVAVARQRVRNEAVIPRIAHRRIKEAVDDECAGHLVHLVFDGFAANRHLDDDIDVFRRVIAGLDRVETHGRSLQWQRISATFASKRHVAQRGLGRTFRDARAANAAIKDRHHSNATRMPIDLPSLTQDRRASLPPQRR